MIRAKTILFPTDLSASAERAYAHAAHLTSRFGATLHVLHIRPPGTAPVPVSGLLPLSMADIVDELRLPDGLGPGGLDPETIVQAQVEGDSAPTAILQYAQEQDVDLIVMGTQGRQGANRLVAGSVAERVVREALCPVLTVRTAGDGTIRRILVPTDFSDRAREAIRYALEAARAYGARVELLHVVDEAALPPAYAPVLTPARVSPEEIKTRSKEAMRKLVQEFQDGAIIEGTVMVGHPARDIVDYAEGGADLIVIATHGRSGIQRLFLGSVTEKVVRRAPCPVFTVRSFGKSLLEQDPTTSTTTAD